MKTRFKLKGFLPIILSIAMAGIVLNFTIEISTNQHYQNKLLASLVALMFFMLTFLWLLLGEVKNKFIIVEFNDNGVLIRKFGGLFPGVKLRSSEIEGWRYSILSSRGGNDEYLYLYQNGRKIAKISEFYHGNYSEIKEFVKGKYKDLGFEKFSYLDEFREIFQ